MSGFALVAGARDNSAGSHACQLAARVSRFKSFPDSPAMMSSEDCAAAKFDTPSSLHRGFAEDAETGSWLLAVGTVVYGESPAEDGNLSRLLLDYLSEGDGVLGRCDGVFALVIRDGRTGAVSVISDPFGFFSVFYAEQAGAFYAATSALAVAAQIGDLPDEISVSCFLRTGKVFGKATLWRRVKRMPAATVLTFRAGKTSERIYWMPAFNSSVSRLSLNESVELAKEVLEKTLSRNLAREKKAWADLTGGYDSRLLLMLLQRVGVPFKANTVGSDGHPDVTIAHSIARTTGWDFQHFRISSDWPAQCPQFLPEALGRGDGHLNVLLSLRAIWAHQLESREHPTLFSGLGGEMWRGPLWWPEKATLGRSSAVNYSRQLWSFMHPIPEPVLRDNTREATCRQITEEFRNVGERYSDLPNTFKLDYLWTYRETAHVGTWMSLPSGLVRAIPPLFSKDIVSHVMSVNYRYKKNNSLVRHLFEQSNPALSAIEIERRGPAAPCRFNNFHRFVPAKLARFRKSAEKLSQILLNRRYHSDNGREHYTRVEWRTKILNFLYENELFTPSHLLTEQFYRAGELRSFLESSGQESFTHDEFLGRVLTLEMAVRAVTGSESTRA